MNNIGSTFIISTIVCTGLFVTALITKPTNKSLDDQLKSDIKSEYEKDKASILPNILSGVVSNLGCIGAKKDIQDYIVFKIATVEIDGDNIKYVGVFNNWIPIESY